MSWERACGTSAGSEQTKKEYQQQEDGDEEGDEEEKTLAVGTSTVNSPMEVCRVTSGVPPSDPPSILNAATGGGGERREEGARWGTAAASGPD